MYCDDLTLILQIIRYGRKSQQDKDGFPSGILAESALERAQDIRRGVTSTVSLFCMKKHDFK